MTWVVGLVGFALVAIILWDAYETILLPRRLPADIRISRLVLRALWLTWRGLSRRFRDPRGRELFLSYFAQLSLIILLGVWASSLVIGFAAMQWSIGSQLQGPSDITGFAADLYLSGTTFFTLGLGDVVPTSEAARFLTVVEAGLGFGFLAMVISYVPVLYQQFARREARITMLDEWAGSPPAAGLILRRAFESRDPNAALDRLFHDWEQASAEILESHLSYPTLALFRSQHDNQSWLASLGAVLDGCALAATSVRDIDPFQARLTFAIGRHTLVDVAQVFRLTPREEYGARCSPERLQELRAWLSSAGVPLIEGPDAERRFVELRRLYTPYLDALSEYLAMPLPEWLPRGREKYNWKSTEIASHDS